jgi:hypothetical protein
MTPQMLTQTQQSSIAPALPGTWKLAAGRAITLRPRKDGVLRVAHGRLWVTFDGPHAGPRNDLGDHFIGVNEQLRLRAGQRLVAEAWNDGAPAYFSWDPLLAHREAPRLAAVAQPLADLRLAWSLGAGAVARLVTGLAGVAWRAVAGRRDPLAECGAN